MCGIAGIVAPDREGLRPLLAMTGALRHRGPDDEGYLLADTRAGRVLSFRGKDTLEGIADPPLPADPPEGMDLGFGHRRLAIIDLGPGGHGPMRSADGGLFVTYNGEVFNYLELRDELRGLGHAFRTASDTEVLLAAFRNWGADALHRFNGMWAFALYDAHERVLFCARDRFGVKPLHYFWDGALFLFASEIKGLLAHPAVSRRVHDPAVHAFLVEGALDEGEETFFEGIRRLPPGHQLVLRLGSRTLQVEPWYTLPGGPAGECHPAELRALLEDSVRLRLRSDVDVGTCLSGGLDSSSIVAVTASLRMPMAGSRRRSFSIVYPDEGLDESAYVDAVVQATDVSDTRETPTAAELVCDLPALVRDQDEPFASPAVYSQWRVMQLAQATGVKVLLDGQGADEVLAGYHYHFGPYLAEVAAEQGLSAAIAEARQASKITGRRLAFLLALVPYHVLPMPPRLRAQAVARFATNRPLPVSLLEPGFDAAARSATGTSARHQPRVSLLAERRANIALTSLPALLRYEDRSSMAFSIEARTPFLDYRLVEHALSLPASCLIHQGWTKHVLREAMRGVLPEAVRLRRDKLGFATPEKRWLREIAPQLRMWLGPGARVRRLVRADALEHWRGAPDDTLASRPGLWRLLTLELWLRYLEDTAVRP